MTTTATTRQPDESTPAKPLPPARKVSAVVIVLWRFVRLLSAFAWREELARAEAGYQCYVRNSTTEREKLRRKLCAVGLHPGYHDTPEKAADAVVGMIAYFRAELANPPADVCGLVMEKYGVEGFTGDKPARCRLVSLPNNAHEPRA